MGKREEGRRNRVSLYFINKNRFKNRSHVYCDHIKTFLIWTISDMVKIRNVFTRSVESGLGLKVT